MKRDMKLIREILERMERSNGRTQSIGEAAGGDTRGWVIIHHLHIMLDAGLVHRDGDGEYRLTWKGHDYLDKLREDEAVPY